MGFIEDTTVYVKSKNCEQLSVELERLGKKMVNYCNENGLILNGQKTQILTTARKKIDIKIDKDICISSHYNKEYILLKLLNTHSRLSLLYIGGRENYSVCL